MRVYTILGDLALAQEDVDICYQSYQCPTSTSGQRGRPEFFITHEQLLFFAGECDVQVYVKRGELL